MKIWRQSLMVRSTWDDLSKPREEREALQGVSLNLKDSDGDGGNSSVGVLADWGMLKDAENSSSSGSALSLLSFLTKFPPKQTKRRWQPCWRKLRYKNDVDDEDDNDGELNGDPVNSGNEDLLKILTPPPALYEPFFFSQF